MPLFPEADLTRFWSKVDQRGENECWNWLASLKDGEYGNFWFGGRNMFSHRFAYMAAKGDIAPGLCVCHACDNPRCCNPAHLWLGTVGDNSRDRDRKGRGADRRGTAHGMSKLDDTKVLEIRRLYAAGGVSHGELGRMFGVASETCRRVLIGESWRHI